MDQLRSVMKAIARQHFWILSGLVVVLCLVGWWMASGTLVEQYETNSTKVNSEFDSVQNIVNEREHPNEGITQRVLTRTSAEREQVLALWQALYDRQKQEVLQWPEELGDRFLNYIENREPESTIDVQHLGTYQDRVKERFRNLHKIVEAQPPGEGDAQRRGNASLTQGAQSQGSGGFPAYKVQWQDQDELALKFVWEERPSSIKVWITQEDLWVYETLLRIISNVNQNATGAHNASIKVVSALKVGKDAIEGSDTQGRTIRIPVAGAPDNLAQAAPATPAAAPVEGAAEEMILKDRRYLDAEGKPLPASQDGQSAEFKRLPIRMELVMEKLDLPELLVGCANAPLPVEVQQVRINPSESRGGIDWAPPAPGTTTGNSANENQGWVDSPQIGTVIVHGVIYIYNEPDLAALGFSEEEIAERENQGQPAPAGTSAG